MVTVLLLAFGRERDSEAHVPSTTANVPYVRALLAALLVFATAVTLETLGTRAMYGDTHAGHSGRNGNPQMRFGPDAEWRINPLLKTAEHN